VPWRLSEDVELYAEAVLPLLREDPAARTVALTVIDALRGGHRFSDQPMLFGWLEEDGEARGAISHNPPYDVLLSVVPDPAELAAALREAGAAVPGVNGEVETVERFCAAWTDGTELHATTWLEMRLFELGTLTPPDPPPPGAARPAAVADLDLAMGWFDAFTAELALPDRLREPFVRQAIGAGRLWLWEDDGGPVALALRTAPAEGVARVTCVYTPPERRGRRYGGAITAAACADALAREAERVVLFTDAGNPAPNAVYERIGFRPVADHRVVRFG
jgi:RimJ/RimL family protein N-acetyltransferase